MTITRELLYKYCRIDINKFARFNRLELLKLRGVQGLSFQNGVEMESLGKLKHLKTLVIYLNQLIIII